MMSRSWSSGQAFSQSTPQNDPLLDAVTTRFGNLRPNSSKHFTSGTAFNDASAMTQGQSGVGIQPAIENELRRTPLVGGRALRSMAESRNAGFDGFGKVSGVSSPVREIGSVSVAAGVAGAVLPKSGTFLGAVKEYEKNISVLRKERDSLLEANARLREKEDALTRSQRALEKERTDLLSVRGRSDQTSSALNEAVEKLAAVQRRSSQLEEDFRTARVEWMRERKALTEHAEGAERRAAEMAGNVAKQEKTFAVVEKQQREHDAQLRSEFEREVRALQMRYERSAKVAEAAEEMRQKWTRDRQELEGGLHTAKQDIVQLKDKLSDAEVSAKRREGELRLGREELERARARERVSTKDKEEVAGRATGAEQRVKEAQHEMTEREKRRAQEQGEQMAELEAASGRALRMMREESEAKAKAMSKSHAIELQLLKEETDARAHAIEVRAADAEESTARVRADLSHELVEMQARYASEMANERSKHDQVLEGMHQLLQVFQTRVGGRAAQSADAVAAMRELLAAHVRGHLGDRCGGDGDGDGRREIRRSDRQGTVYREEYHDGGPTGSVQRPWTAGPSMGGRRGPEGGSGMDVESGGEEDGRGYDVERRRRSLGALPWEETRREGGDGGDESGREVRGRASLKRGGEGRATGRLRWDEMFESDGRGHRESERKRANAGGGGGGRAREPEMGDGGVAPLREGQVGEALSEISKTIGRATHVQLSAAFKLHAADMLARTLRFKRAWKRAFGALRAFAAARGRGQVLRNAAAWEERRQRRQARASVLHHWQMLVLRRREGVRRLCAVRERGEERRLLLVAVGTWIRTMDWKRAKEEAERAKEDAGKRAARAAEEKAMAEQQRRLVEEALEQAHLTLSVEKERGEAQLQTLRNQHQDNLAEELKRARMEWDRREAELREDASAMGEAARGAAAEASASWSMRVEHDRRVAKQHMQTVVESWQQKLAAERERGQEEVEAVKREVLRAGLRLAAGLQHLAESVKDVERGMDDGNRAFRREAARMSERERETRNAAAAMSEDVRDAARKEQAQLRQGWDEVQSSSQEAVQQAEAEARRMRAEFESGRAEWVRMLSDAETSLASAHAHSVQLQTMLEDSARERKAERKVLESRLAFRVWQLKRASVLASVGVFTSRSGAGSPVEAAMQRARNARDGGATSSDQDESASPPMGKSRRDREGNGRGRETRHGTAQREGKWSKSTNHHDAPDASSAVWATAADLSKETGLSLTVPEPARAEKRPSASANGGGAPPAREREAGAPTEDSEAAEFDRYRTRREEEMRRWGPGGEATTENSHWQLPVTGKPGPGLGLGAARGSEQHWAPTEAGHGPESTRSRSGESVPVHGGSGGPDARASAEWSGQWGTSGRAMAARAYIRDADTAGHSRAGPASGEGRGGGSSSRVQHDSAHCSVAVEEGGAEFAEGGVLEEELRQSVQGMLQPSAGRAAGQSRGRGC